MKPTDPPRMPDQAQTVILLVMTSQASEAERLITSLRNGGLPVRGMYTAHADRIEELVERRACDLIICCAYDPAVTLEAVLLRHRELEADVPLIVIVDQAGAPAAAISAMAGGARDVTARDDAERLQLIVGRELADLRARRQLRRLTQRLRQCEQRARELVDGSDEAVTFIQEGMHVHANPTYLALFRFPSLDDLQAAAFLDLIEPEQRTPVRDFLRERQSAQPQGPAELPVTYVRADASRFPGTLAVAPAEIDGEPCLRLIVRATDRTPLTPSAGPAAAPANRSSAATLLAAIDAAVGAERRASQPFAVFYVRIRAAANLFRDFGLTRALTVIGALAAALIRLCTGVGLLVRISDDGFALLAPGLDEASAESLAERIRTQVRLGPGPGGKARIEADCDVGYVIVAGPCPNSSTLLDEAYRACYGGVAGQTKAVVPQRPTSLAAREKQSAEDGDSAETTKIEWALANERFMLVYQPIISLMGDSQENYSVLVRMIDEAENLIEAKEFIGAAIRSGLIERIDKWAIRHAVKSMSEHRQAGHPLNFFINLAEDSFRDPGVMIWLCDCLREFEVRGSWLTFVIQEELVDGNLASLSRLVESLKKIKCRVAVNRFGATDHPQMLFQGLSLDFVLLLPEFAQGLADDKDKQQRLLTLANMAREFNVKSVVTGVEDARSITILWTAGVDYVQGNFLQRPSPTLEIAT